MKRDTRRSPRLIVTDGTATLNGDVATLKNWSREGAFMTGYTGHMKVGDRGEVILTIKHVEGSIRLQGSAEVVRKSDYNIAIVWKLENEDSYSEEKRKIVSVFFRNSSHEP